MTLAQLIAAHEQRTTPEPISSRAVLTGKGHAAVMTARLLILLKQFSPADRADILGPLALSLAPLFEEMRQPA